MLSGYFNCNEYYEYDVDILFVDKAEKNASTIMDCCPVLREKNGKLLKVKGKC